MAAHTAPPRMALLAALLCLLAACGRPTSDFPTPPPAFLTQVSQTATIPPPSPMPPVPPAGGGTTAHRPILGEKFSLQGGETMFVDTPGDRRGPKIELRFASVASDSRCPRMVQCVVAGDAAILIVASIGADARQLTLHSTPFQQQADEGLPGYDIQLVELGPLPDYPEDRLELGQYTAHLLVLAAGASPPPATPVASAPPKITVDACSLVPAELIADLFGAVTGPPLPRKSADGRGQTCLVQTERASLDIRMLPGDAAAAGAVRAELQQAGLTLAAPADDPTERSVFGQDGMQAALVTRGDAYTLALIVVFGRQAQDRDRGAARSNLETMQSVAMVRYAAGATEDAP